MVSDAIQAALIGESIDGKDRSRRRAAQMLLQVLRRNGEVLGDFGKSAQDVIPSEDVLAVAEEMKALIAKYHLGGSDRPADQPSADARGERLRREI